MPNNEELLKKIQDMNLSDESFQEIQIFLKEKERIRKLIGAIGGKPKKWDKLVNILFAVFVLTIFIATIFFHGIQRLISIEVGILLVSLKLIYFLHNEAKVNHFQFWILSTLEWKINELDAKLKKIEKLLDDNNNKDEKK